MLSELYITCQKSLIFLTLFLGLLAFDQVTAQSAYADSESQDSAAIIVSQKIRPYLAAVEGISETLSSTETSFEIIFLSDFPSDAQPSLEKKLLSNQFGLLIAIGPEAANFIDSFPPRPSMPLIIRTMLLNPKQIQGNSSCGIFLNIPISIQVANITATLPSVQSIGLLYDPKLNSDFFTSAAHHANQLGKKIIPMAVAEKRAIPSVLQSHWKQIDALWFIPDRTVISESIITHVTKQAILYGIPSIGFNSFFRDSGAVMSFVFNYHDLGKQTAELGLRLLDGATCQQEVPHFQIEFNQKVITNLAIPVSEQAAASEEEK